MVSTSHGRQIDLQSSPLSQNFSVSGFSKWQDLKVRLLMASLNQLDEYIFTVSEFMSVAECQTWIEKTEATGYSRALVSLPDGKQSVSGNRNNDRVILDDSTTAEELWNKLEPFCLKFYKGYSVVGLNERLRFYRYHPGQLFRWHKDGSFRRENGETSRLTFMVYLNEEFAGGETLFEHLSVSPKTGMAILFAHGYLHEGGEVFNGTKYVLRTDVMYSAQPFEIDDD